jgi:nitrite reductase (NO-forming)
MTSLRLTLGVLSVVLIAFTVGALSMLVLPIQPSLASSSGGSGTQPTVQLTLYGGEISSQKFGFGFSPGNITSPGPPLKFNTTDVVQITFVNAGKFPHAFMVTDSPKTGGKELFNAAIASGSQPLEPGQSGKVTFTPNKTGNFYYICPVPGHAELGMWGNLTVVAPGS